MQINPSRRALTLVGRTKKKIESGETKKPQTNLRLLDDSSGLADHGGRDEDLFADHGVVPVIGVVGVPELAVGAELELEELVPELALVPRVVPQVELRIAAGRRHCRRHDSFGWLLRVDREDFFSGIPI